MNRQSLILLAAILFPLTSPARATQINDSAFGFSLTVPDGFIKSAPDPSNPDLLYIYMDREPSPGNPAIAIQVQRLRGVISPKERMDPKKLRKVPGMVRELLEFKWKGLDLDIVRQTVTIPPGGKFVSYATQFQLSREAVQLQVGGPSQRDKAIHELFSKVAESFNNTRPLYQSNGSATGDLSQQERDEALVLGIVRIALVAIAVIIILRFLIRVVRGKKRNE